MEIEESSWAGAPSVPLPSGLPEEPFAEPMISSPMVGSKRPLPCISTGWGPRSSPRFKRQLVRSEPDQVCGLFPPSGFLALSQSSPQHSMLFPPPPEPRDFPVAVTSSRYDTRGGVSHTSVVMIKTEYATMGSGGLFGVGNPSSACVDALTVAQSLLRLRAAQLSACLGRPLNPEMATQKRPVQVRLEGPALATVPGAAPGCGMFLSLLQHYLGIGMRPGVAVTGEVSLCGRLVSTGGAAAKVQAALAAGMLCVVLPMEDEEEVERDLGPREKAAVVFARDVLDLLQHTVAGFFKRQPDVDLERGVGLAPTLLPFDDVLVAFRWVEAAVLPRTEQAGGNGGFIVTGVQEDGNCLRSALNAARFLLLKHQVTLSQLLGPPAIDLQHMRRLPAPAAGAGMSSGQAQQYVGPVDIHVHVPQALHSAAYAVPALLSLVTVVWGMKDPTSQTVSLGELNMLGRMEFKETLRPSFVSAVRLHRMRKVIIPRTHALKLVSELGGVGDRAVACGGVVVQGAEGLLDLVRHAFLGGDLM